MRVSGRALRSFRMSPYDAALSSYSALLSKASAAASLLGRPLTYAEKLLFGHLKDPRSQHYAEGDAYLALLPDRVAMQDASAQTALLQFMQSGLPHSAVPASVHCDHLIVAQSGAQGSGAPGDVEAARRESGEVFEFLRSACQRYGIGFWGPGSGIIHQIVLENYAFPGGLMVGTDSHTPNAGGLGIVACGVGGADAVDVMAGIGWEVKQPRILGVHLKGELSGWAAPKDVITKLAGHLTVKGGTGYVIEYFGEGVQTLSATAMATICNMGAEVGATTSVFPFTPRMADYLRATRRADIAEAAEAAADSFLSADEGCRYHEVVEIDLSKLEPRINGPFTPDLSHTLREVGEAAEREGWPLEVSAALIGSCTNSSYYDMTRAVSLVRQAEEAGLKPKAEFLVTPGSEQIRATLQRDGILDDFEAAGAQVLANACGPCIGQWNRSGVEGKNTIVNSYNRNFAARNDGNTSTHSFVTSPEVTTALAYAGRLDFDPATDDIDGFRFEAPQGIDLPPDGFDAGNDTYLAPPEDGSDVEVVIDPASERLQEIAPFEAWDGSPDLKLRVLMKVEGKCTTDHISPAGPWLRYKGHLENISQCTLIGATNAENGERNSIWNVLRRRFEAVPTVAEDYKKAGIAWAVVAGENYGEGSAREHAALQPRFLGGRAVIVQSFARIHEANLKKQGVLPLTFVNKEDYEALGNGVLTLHALNELAPGKTVRATFVSDEDGSKREVELQHTMSQQHIDWWKAGSALNAIAASKV